MNRQKYHLRAMMKRSSSLIGKFAVLSFLAVLLPMGCSAKDDPNAIFLSQKENGYGKAIKDSIASIMLNPKSVKCTLQSKNPTDTLRQDTVCVVSKDFHSVVKYLFFDENNFKSDDVVYGKFIPWACLTFEGKKKQTLYLELDFGLSKWRLLNSEKKQICSRDMKENNKQFLHLVRLLFPQDKTLKVLQENFNAPKNEKK